MNGFSVGQELPKGQHQQAGLACLAVERRFVPISAGESQERSHRLHLLLLAGARRLACGSSPADCRNGEG